MRLTKKLLAVTVAVICVFTCALGALAEGITAEVTDNVNGVVSITGTAPGKAEGRTVNILVTNEGYTAEDAISSPSAAIQYQDSAITGAGGAFSKNFMLNFGSGDEEGTFTVYIGGDDFTADTIEEISIYYASMGLKIEKAAEFLAAPVLEDEEDSEETYAHEVLEENKAILGIDKDLYNALDNTRVAALLKSYVEEEGIEFAAPLDENVEGNTEIYVTFNNLMETAIVIEGFNQNKQNLLIKNDELVYDELIGLTDYLDDNGTLLEAFEGTTDDGKKLAMEGLFGQDVTSAEELQKIYAKQVILNAIKNNKTSGYGIIDDILTSDNAAAAGLEIPTYLALDSTTLADDSLYSGRDDLTYDNLENKIEDAAEIEEDVSEPSEDDNDTKSTTSSRGGLSGSISVQPVTSTVEETVTFTDLSGYDWASEAINALAQKKIINGIGDSQFSPAGSLTREAAAKIIMLALNIAQKSGTPSFSDVSADAWYAPYVYTLNTNGIVNGISEAEFGVGRQITREDFAVMLYRALGASFDNGALAFTDADSISSYASAAVGYFAEKGIINGYEDGSFAPKAFITRAEGAKIIYSIIK